MFINNINQSFLLEDKNMTKIVSYGLAKRLWNKYGTEEDKKFFTILQIKSINSGTQEQKITPFYPP
jgi:hypothetical protein